MNPLNICIDRLPETVDIKGEHVAIRTDFRIGMLFEEMVEESVFQENDAVIQAFRLWFEDEQIIRILSLSGEEDAMRGILWFYSCGKPQDRKQGKEQKKNGFQKRLYDFEVDAPLIYSAFYSQYRIDLQTEKMHWWKFCALFSGLHDQEQIVRVIGYRGMNLSSIKNKEERRRIARLQAMYALPDYRSVEEKERMAGAVFGT